MAWIYIIDSLVFVTLLIQSKCSIKCCYTDENVWSRSQENCSKTLNVRNVRPAAWLVKTVSQFVTSHGVFSYDGAGDVLMLVWTHVGRN